ncbi:LOW QUALITY PROTEIN: transport protein [Halarchaeum acidiphilum MH1-52-1]|uniref:Transport protein n=1 Tax=Halarchaeum acidiphilum MH1-52-1 TaxID=1261545 RepID=U2YUN5_9EURY|nr:LOW QUALITY PROTEIN: transport protein [Halarchaeum acidiphilum MH1-52-1]
MVDLDYQAVIDRIDYLVGERPGTVILVFLLVTAGLAAGLGGISTSSGTSQFTSGSPAQQALDQVDEKFGTSFGTDTASTQLIQRDQNVLAKPALLRMLRTEKRVRERENLHVAATSSVADTIATTLDPSARTERERIDTVEDATPSEIDAAVKRAAGGGLAGSLSNDFNPEAASASATVGVVTHEIPGSDSSSAGTSGGSSPVTTVQQRVQSVVQRGGTSDVTVFGSGILSAEFGNVITDSLLIVVPAAAILILLFLVFSYRDPLDLLIGVVSLVMAIIWTFGFLGLADIPFSQMLVVVPALLLAVGIDFGIHAINRYREERSEGYGVVESMETTTDQLLVAFFIVTGTTVLGFLANLTSSLGPIRDLGLVSAIGITFTVLIFGIFLPAAKVYTDRWREEHDIPQFGMQPLGGEGSLIGRFLPYPVLVARKAPYVFLALVVIFTAVAAGYGTGVNTSFSQDDFLPPSQTPGWYHTLPEPFAPHEYHTTATLDYLDEHFTAASGSGGSVTMYIRGPLRKDYALESIHHASYDPPDSFVISNSSTLATSEPSRYANTRSIIDVIRSYAQRDASFRHLVRENDVNGNGIPDDDLGTIYDRLLDSPYHDQAREYLSRDERATRVSFTTKGNASQADVVADAHNVDNRYRLNAIATGQPVVFQYIADTILESAVKSLAVALLATALFLLLCFRVFSDYTTLGLVNLFPIVVTVALLAGAMRYLGIPLNALTATVLSISIGLGVDYSSHIVHRFGDEYEERDLYDAIDVAVRGTGGALTGSMLTTVAGIGVLVLAITPILGDFGSVTALSIFISYVLSVVVTPSAMAVWGHAVERYGSA